MRIFEVAPASLTATINAWIEKVYARFPQTWNDNHVMDMGGEGDDQQLVFFELAPSFTKRGAVEVKWFQAYPQRQGVGSRAMRTLQDMAREDGIILTLYPWKHGRVSQGNLKKFYKKAGYKPINKGADAMIWSPTTEAFDKPYKSKWETSDYDDVDVLARLPDGTNLSIMFNHEGHDEWQVEFYRDNSQAVTGQGDAQRIFATVINAIQKFVKKHKPLLVRFSASKEVEPGQNNQSRAKLYDRLVQRYAHEWGYEMYQEDHGDQVTYELTRLEGVTENFADSTGRKQSLNVLSRWKNDEPVSYVKHLQKFFGPPEELTNQRAIWYNKDGFKRIEVLDEFILHTSPIPHYDYVYSYVDMKVPHNLSDELANSSESILIDHLKGEVGGRCATLSANAVTLQYVMDVVEGKVRPSKVEYEKRIMAMHAMFDNGERYELDWWPDVTGDTDPDNPYYKEENIRKDK